MAIVIKKSDTLSTDINPSAPAIIDLAQALKDSLAYVPKDKKKASKSRSKVAPELFLESPAEGPAGEIAPGSEISREIESQSGKQGKGKGGGQTGTLTVQAPDSESLSSASSSSSSAPVLAESINLTDLDESTQKALTTLCTEYRRLSKIISDSEKTQKVLKPEIEELAFSISAKKIIGSGWNATRAAKTTTYLDKDILVDLCLENDIDPVTVLDIIAKSTVEKKGKEYVTVTEG